MDVQVSSSFKKMTYKAIFSIVVFIIVFLILIAIGLALAIGCAFGAFVLFIAKPNLFTGAVGLGLLSLGFFVLAFLFKFLFQNNRVDTSHLTEITETDEPKLFQLISELVQQIGTDFPKRIYLSHEVNAVVFYDSNFWSMFLPIRKNLQIGLGLVNSVSLQELKGILAHEFGHFSQRSMKVGSYVYNVNQVIHNMLYNNDALGGKLNEWANISGYFWFFSKIAVQIIRIFQVILSKLYDYINLNYLALSREMEFHADEVATHVAGTVPMKESMLRMNLADYSFNSVINFFDNKISQNVKCQNLYLAHDFVMRFIANQNKLSTKYGLPQIEEIELGKYNKSKLVIDNQWASHPSLEDRVSAFNKLNISKEYDPNLAAASIFVNIRRTEEAITEKLFSRVQYAQTPTILEAKDFEEEYKAEFERNSLPSEYNGYYDNKDIINSDINELEIGHTEDTLETLFGKEKVDMVYEWIGLEGDKSTLVAIANGQADLKTFDYAGFKYKAKEALQLIPKLDAEIAQLKENIAAHDARIKLFFWSKASERGKLETLREAQQSFFEIDSTYEDKLNLVQKIFEDMEFINHTTSFDRIKYNLLQVEYLEEKLKAELRQMLQLEYLAADISEPMRENLEKYVQQKWLYFLEDSYNDANLQMFFAALNDYRYLHVRHYFLEKKKLLQIQLDLIR